MIKKINVIILKTSFCLTLLSLCISVICGCADRPKDAPKEFQELTSFLYEHLMDEDDTALALGAENMFIWLNENTASVRKGYTVKRLTAEAIATTGKSSNPNDLIGGASLTAHGHKTVMLSRALGVDNVKETNGDSYQSYTRTYEGDAECFAKRECPTLEGDSRSTSSWAGGLVEIKYDTHVQFRWVKTKYGPIMLHRTFMNKKPQINLDIIDAKQGYYLGVAFPPLLSKTGVSSEETETLMDPSERAEEGGFEATTLDLEIDESVNPQGDTWGESAFLQVNWLDVDYGILPVTEDRALEMLVESLVEVAVSIEKWMDKYYRE